MGVKFREILDAAGGEAAELVPAEVVVAALGGLHQLVLPMDGEGTVLHDFSALDFRLLTIAQAKRKPVLPVDIRHLVALCRHHARTIAAWESWSYTFFYLELLAREGKVVPLFWGDTNVLLWDFHDGELIRQYTHGATRAPAEPAACLRGRWARQLDAWVQRAVIVPHSRRPWMERLEYVPPDTGQRWDLPPMPFSHCLRFRMQPYYHIHDATEALRHHMKLELWRTSVFCPRPITPLNRKEWREHCRRFAVSYRLRTEQWKRKQEFEQFVKCQHSGPTETIEIARQALREGLWPYGTPRGGDTDDEARVAACRSAVYRALRKIASGKL